MSASPSEDFVAYTPAELGLHRGRRVLAGCCLAALLSWAGHALVPAQQKTAGPQLPEASPEPAAAPARPFAPRAEQPKRRSKSARMGARGSPRALASVECEPIPSAPPLVAAAVVVEPEAAELEVPPAPAPEPEADQPVAPQPEVEVADDGNGEAIARAIAAAKRGAVQTCFERELKQTPTLTGTLIVELDLAPPQRVNAVRVTDDLHRPEFTQCVTSTMDHLSFVALNEEVSVRVPYLLSARSK